jgi:hypothetical protein
LESHNGLFVFFFLGCVPYFLKNGQQTHKLNNDFKMGSGAACAKPALLAKGQADMGSTGTWD